MIFFKKMKDGGQDSPVDGYFLIECKSLFSIALLKFNRGTREAYHNHAFNAFTWFLSGMLIEDKLEGDIYFYGYSLIPKYTSRDNMHRVIAVRDSWCLTIRGPWCKTWMEYKDGKYILLSNGRKEVK